MLKELLQKSDTIPKGWKNSYEWAAYEKCSITSIGRYLRKAVDMDLMEKKFFRVLRSNVVRPIPYYKLK